MSTSHDTRVARLAAEPLRVTGPQPGVASGFVAQVKDLWAHRELLDLLIRRELKARYKDSTLGFVWSLLRPLTLLLIYAIAIGQFLGAARQIPEFAIFIYAGLTIWNLFTETVTSGTASIVGNSGLIKKVYLPREVFPLAGLGSALFNFAVQLLLLVVATLIIGDPPTGERWLYFPATLAVTVVWGLAWALLLAAVNVYLRDVQYLVEVAVMVFFWVSPIVYSWGLVQPRLDGWLEDLYLANPMALAVMGFQKVFWVAGDGQPVPENLLTRLGIAFLVGVVFTFVAQRVFARLQGNFAQEL
ncbi:ABC transporter permease [Cellulomonas marina]|uniref:Transport permease protein n=1 Tax=Cellulomonas marina TaxID=988821 RepID=A0A1I0UYF9_9CELL|nr:ABC transporter permease [Cellulomonas marina]GIG29928.1 transport permease protein [Cellulomonas marina]SFA69042.1 ABC-2 type transport system permease protein [Cellulomonas marina]